jgi:Rrf2 family protein
VLGKTTLSALRALLFLTQQEPAACLSPRHIAAVLGESPTYLAKVLRHLVKAGVLRAERGATGGVRLAMAPEDVTLLDVVEACQGTIVGNYCQATVADGRRSRRGYHHELISCQVACPVHTDARGYVRAIAEGRGSRTPI